MRLQYGTHHRVIDAAVRDDCLSWVKCAFDVFPHWTGGRCEQKKGVCQGTMGGRVPIFCGRTPRSVMRWPLSEFSLSHGLAVSPISNPSAFPPRLIAQLPCPTRGRSRKTAESQLSLYSLHAMEILADHTESRRNEEASALFGGAEMNPPRSRHVLDLCGSRASASDLSAITPRYTTLTNPDTQARRDRSFTSSGPDARRMVAARRERRS